MSKELETRVETLMRLEEEKRAASKKQYGAKKAYDAEYGAVFAMVESGHVMPKGSSLFAEIVTEPAGRVNHKYALEKFVAGHPQYANTIRQLQEESKQQDVEKLKYGAAS